MTQGIVIALLVGAVVVLGTGVRLTAARAPYGAGLLAVHKLVDLAAAVAIGYLAYRAYAAGPLSPLQTAVFSGTIVLGLPAFASGGAVSAAGAAPPRWAVWSHRVGGFLLLPLAAYAVYLAL